MEFYSRPEQERLGVLIIALKEKHPEKTAAERADIAIVMLAHGVTTNGNGIGH